MTNTAEVVERLDALCRRAEEEYPQLAAPDGTVAVPFTDLRTLIEALSTRQVPTPEITEAGELTSSQALMLLVERVGQEFDGECHLSEAEAFAIARLIEHRDAALTAMSQKAAPAVPSEEALRELRDMRNIILASTRDVTVGHLIDLFGWNEEYSAIHALAAPPTDGPS